MSTLTPQLISTALKLQDVQYDAMTNAIVWTESRGKQTQVMACFEVGQAPVNLTPEYSVRGEIGYGGGAYGVGAGKLVFCHKGQLYAQSLISGIAKAITPTYGAVSAPVISQDGKYVAYIHEYNDQAVLAVVDIEGVHWPQKLLQGDDFYMQPCWSPDGNAIAVIAWNHPQMPWDGTELRLLTLAYASVLPHTSEVKVIAGKADVSIFQPCFSPNGEYLAYASDETGSWTPTIYSKNAYRQLDVPVGEYGMPGWIQGMQTLAWGSDSQELIVRRNYNAQHTLIGIDVESGAQRTLDLPSRTTHIENFAVTHNGIALAHSSPTMPIRVSAVTPTQETVLARSFAESLLPKTVADAEHIAFETDDGSTVYGVLFSPNGTNTDTLPPLIVNIHGGPTSQTSVGYDSTAQYFSSRGWAFLAVNYRGSTGYGRDYVLKLRGRWGEADVADAVYAAKHLVAEKRVHPDQCVIMGGSAGGMTVYLALANYPGVFKAGVSRYGVADLYKLATDTHKFEARYLDTLVGKLPEEADKYERLSPMTHVDKIQDPVIIFQGADDKVVPPSQSEAIVASLKARSIPHEYHVFEGEGHGFRKQETLNSYYRKLEQFLKTYVLS